ncbi:MAG: choice-of-anchor I family protein, partial [Actinomycetota bacterium]
LDDPNLSTFRSVTAGAALQLDEVEILGNSVHGRCRRCGLVRRHLPLTHLATALSGRSAVYGTPITSRARGFTRDSSRRRLPFGRSSPSRNQGVLICPGALLDHTNRPCSVTPNHRSSRGTLGPRLGITSIAAGLGGTAGAQTTEGLTPLGTYESGATDEGGAEIVDFDPATDQLYVTNGFENTIDIIDVSDPTAPTLASQVDLAPYGGGGVQSVSVGNGEFAAAVDASDPTLNGKVVRFTTAGVFIAEHEVGNLPDAIAYTPDGTKIIVANEGEPICQAEPNEDDLQVDPAGTVSIIDVTTPAVTTADFTGFDAATLLAEDVRIFFPGSTAAQDLEPEYVTTDGDGTTAYVTLQENNAIAVVDIATSTVTDVFPLGYKDHSVAGNGLDPSNEDGPTGDGIENIQLWDVLGMYQPDAIAVAELGGSEYLVTANEGDARDDDCFSEEERIKDFGLAVPPYAAGDDDENLGRLRTTSALPTTFDGGGAIEQAYSYGARSFTVWNAETGSLVFDSGDQFEQQLLGTPQWVESRNDDKGPSRKRSPSVSCTAGPSPSSGSNGPAA